MNAPVIQVKYDELETVISRLRNQIAQTQALKTALRSSYQPLQQGGWLGEGSQAFIREMDQIVFPAVNRLENALQQAEGVTREIIAIMRAAEEEASRPFRGGPTADGGGAAHSALHDAGELLISQNGDDGGSSNHSAGEDGATLGVKEDGSIGPLKASDAWKEVKPVRDPHSLFTDEYMRSLIGRKWQGEGNMLLTLAMHSLNGNPSPGEVSLALDTIALVRGVDRAELGQQYETFKALQKQYEQNPNPNKGEIEQLLPIQFQYMGSHDQLRFGQILGDAYDIDPVFGALLNPTGGMPGAGQWGIPLGDSAIGYHSAFHDAGGFMLMKLGEGPGYNYLGLENRPTDDPLTGQESGLNYWNNIFHPFVYNELHLKGASTAFGIGAGIWVDHGDSIKQGLNIASIITNPTPHIVEKSFDMGVRAGQEVTQRVQNTYNKMQGFMAMVLKG